MPLDDTIPKISKIAIFLIIAFILNVFTSSLFAPFLASQISRNEYATVSITTSIVNTISLILGFLLNIIIAVWINREAAKQNEERWIWTAFSLFFGLMAVVAFYLLLVIRELRALRTELKEMKKDAEI
jgi:ACR3 family arsenite efflux pump ArsB